MTMKKLQIALDEFSLEESLALCEKVRDYIDIIEIGTPFIMREGMGTVIAFRERFPEKEILADAKIMDAGKMEAAICFEAGADILIVGGSISRAEDPETAARNISAKVHR